MTKKIVSFVSTEPLVCEVLPHLDYSEEERQATWYTETELQNIKYECESTVYTCRHSKIDESDEHCVRGLEAKTKEGYRSLKNIKKRAKTAVLDEDMRQRQMDIRDPIALAKEYQAVTFDCSYPAYVRAVMDAQEAAAYTTNESRSEILSKLKPLNRHLFLEVLLETAEDALKPGSANSSSGVRPWTVPVA